jgi:hypothetical protein
VARLIGRSRGGSTTSAVRVSTLAGGLGEPRLLWGASRPSCRGPQPDVGRTGAGWHMT